MKKRFSRSAVSAETLGFGYGLLGILCFSLTLPATRVAVTELDPMFVGLGRGLLAAGLAAIALVLTRQPWPRRSQWLSLAVVAVGVVLGFPLLSAWAMRQLPAAHGAVVLGLLPLATAVAGVLRAGDRPSPRFWLASAIGNITVVSFGIFSGANQLLLPDGLLLLAVVAAALGYAEGGKLAKTIGGWQVICWALLLAAPFILLPTIATAAQHGLTASPRAWLGFLYLGCVSQFLGFFAWYHGLALGGVARVGQVQLLQPFFTLVAAALLLDESIDFLTIGAAIIVVCTVAIGRRAAIHRAAPQS